MAAKGWEVEATANPTKNWRVTFNAARQEAVLDNVGNELTALFESWKPALIDGRAGDVPGQQANLTLRDWFELQVAALNRPRALQGSKSPEIRKWRFNFVNNYRFTEGRLKGWNVGGAVRWQDKAAIGYPVISIGSQGQYDVTKPYYGPTETNFDGWVGYARRLWNDRIGWKVQLNVRNIGVRNRLIPVSAQPYGEIDTYRTGASMTWSLTNSFSF